MDPQLSCPIVKLGTLRPSTSEEKTTILLGSPHALAHLGISISLAKKNRIGSINSQHGPMAELRRDPG